MNACRGQRGAVADLVARQEALATEVEALKREVSETRRGYLKSIEAKETDFEGFAEQVRELSATAEAIRQTMQEFALYKQAYRKQARAKAPGMELGDLPVGSQVYRKAKVREVTDTHLSLAHESGTTRLPLAEAPPALQDLFAYDPLLDAVVQQAEGTGTDWLLSAMETAQQVLKADPIAGNARTVATVSTGTGPSSTGSGFSSASTLATPVSSYRVPYTTYYSTSEVPAWRRFNNFTGSFWAPLKNRRRSGESVNTWVPSSTVFEP